MSREKYWQNVIFHNKIEKVVRENYNVEPKWSKVISWGYNTTCVYLEDTNSNKYAVKVKKNNKINLDNSNRDIKVAHFLNSIIPTTKYLLNKDGNYITVDSKQIFTLHHFVTGITPFDMNKKTLSDMVVYSKKIHSKKIPAFELPIYEDILLNTYKLLHGDLTPSNTLISHGKITGIIDFEEAIIGPVELDLARTTVFSWFWMKEYTYSEVLKIAISAYNEKLNIGSIINFSINFLDERLLNLNMHKKDYEDLEFWKTDKKFTTKKLNEIKKLKQAMPLVF